VRVKGRYALGVERKVNALTRQVIFLRIFGKKLEQVDRRRGNVHEALTKASYFLPALISSSKLSWYLFLPGILRKTAHLHFLLFQHTPKNCHHRRISIQMYQKCVTFVSAFVQLSI
jgi:hypothetical protein